MIIRRLKLENWRGLKEFEMELAPGINVLVGPNEAGKSSVVEAIDWALYRDIAGARLPQDEIRSILPGGDQQAIPRVTVELEFPDCTAAITKTLALESSKRECRLTIHRPQAAAENFDRTEAQRRLRTLFMADGLGEEKGNVAESSLLVAHQGEAASYLADGSTAMRSTLGVGADGTLALTSRLERIRLQVETSRRRDLTQDLKADVLLSARAGTEAALVRDELAEARRQLEHFQAAEREMEALREEAAELQQRLEVLLEAERACGTDSENFSDTSLRQAEADKSLSEAESALREAESRRNLAAEKLAEIERLRSEQVADAERLAGCTDALKAAQENLELAREAYGAALEVQERANAEVDDARQLTEAWRVYLAVFDARELQRNEARLLERVEGLEQAAQESQSIFEGLEKCPSRLELAAWRGAREELAGLEREAGQALQLTLTPEVDGVLVFTSDGGAGQEITFTGGDSISLNAMAEGELRLPGFGTLRVKSGARGVEELREKISGSRRALAVRLEPWGVTIEELAAALPVFETNVAAYEEAESQSKAAASASAEAQRVHGTAEELRQRVAARQADYEEAKRNCEPYAGLISLGGRLKPEVKAALEAARATLRELESRAARARNDAAASNQKLRMAESEAAQAGRQPEVLQAAISSREGQLARLEADGLSPEERSKQVEDLAAELWAARQKVEARRSARAELGNAVSSWQIDEARRAAAEASRSRAEVEMRLAEVRRDIWHHSGEDAGGQIQKLRNEIEELENRAALCENRLRGLALLDAALKIERSRLGRALAGPLNDQLSPWLSSLRGRETRIEFDESGSRIERVVTRTESGLMALPFGDHSEGMKEQTALALRLLLAARVASHLPSKRLAVLLDDPFTQSDLARREGMAVVLREAEASLQLLIVSCHEDQIPSSLEITRVRLGAEPTPTAAVKSARVPRAKKTEAGEASLSLF